MRRMPGRSFMPEETNRVRASRLVEELGNRDALYQIDTEAIPDVLGQLEMARAILQARMLASQRDAEKPADATLITIEEMAKRT